ncbi:MAG: hypothetical protein IPJ69_13470 [Deltaproteobacteria bacterium]|nr:MAG: hypothetical protein IPJ69_13470 [Deltaproteobacteria bacterium]
MKLKILSLFFTMIFSISAQAYSEGIKLGKAGKVVEKFCRQDSQGVRLSSGENASLYRLTTWEEEPGWDTIKVIKDFHITQETYLNHSAQVSVIYTVTAKQNDEGAFVNTHEEEKVLYKLVKVKDQWKIEGPQLMPHVLKIPK